MALKPALAAEIVRSLSILCPHFDSRRLRNMWLNILQLHDQDLFDHLEALSVLPTTFGINWTKLLFSRFGPASDYCLFNS